MVGSMFKGEDTDADPSPSPSSSLSSGTSVNSIDRVRQSLTDSRLLSKVLRLANPGKVNSEGEGPKVSGVAFCRALSESQLYIGHLSQLKLFD